MIDGGNSYYRDDIRRSHALKRPGHPLRRRRRERRSVRPGAGLLPDGRWRRRAPSHGSQPVLEVLAPGVAAAPRTEGREQQGSPTPAEQGWLHCGPSGAGHFVKMVHNGIEYGIMAAYAEGLNVLRHADVGRQDHAVDAETTPLREPELYQYEFDLKEIAELWRRGSVISSWLLDLTAHALLVSPRARRLRGPGVRLGRGAVDGHRRDRRERCPTPVLTTALYERFSSRGEADFADQVLSAMRFEFGGHHEKPGVSP